jgi:hypothetical protein
MGFAGLHKHAQVQEGLDNINILLTVVLVFCM